MKSSSAIVLALVVLVAALVQATEISNKDDGTCDWQPCILSRDREEKCPEDQKAIRVSACIWDGSGTAVGYKYCCK